MASIDKSDVPIFHAIATTGLFEPGFVPEICQLVLTKDTEDEKTKKTQLFCKYILPDGDFDEGASKINGFEVKMQDGKRHLVRETMAMKTSTLDKVMKDFIDTIASIRDQGAERIILFGYCNKDYDMEVMKKEMSRCGVSTEKISSVNVVCADLYQLVVSNKSVLLPAYSGSLTMTAVYNELCGDERVRKYDALEDAEMLRKIYRAIIGRVDKQTFERCIFPFPVVEAPPRAVIPSQEIGEPQQKPRCSKRNSSDESNPQPGRPDTKKARR